MLDVTLRKHLSKYETIYPKIIDEIKTNMYVDDSILRSSRPDVFCEKGVLRNFAKFTGKRLCQGLFLNKGVGTGVFL